jgi:hypothetical protein
MRCVVGQLVCMQKMPRKHASLREEVAEGGRGGVRTRELGRRVAGRPVDR